MGLPTHNKTHIEQLIEQLNQKAEKRNTAIFYNELNKNTKRKIAELISKSTTLMTIWKLKTKQLIEHMELLNPKIFEIGSQAATLNMVRVAYLSSAIYYA